MAGDRRQRKHLGFNRPAHRIAPLRNKRRSVYVNTIVRHGDNNPLLTPRVCCLCGLFGSLLFLAGDMLFYGSATSGADFHAYREMATHSTSRLIIGGALGPVAALFSALGMGIFYATAKPAGARLGGAASFLLASTILIGGAYHAVFTNFGFASKISDEFVRQTLLNQVASLWTAISYPMYAAGIVGSLAVYFLVLSGRSHLPKWLLIFLPTILSLASSVFRSYFLLLPPPIGGLIRGGWINGCFVLFFAICTIVIWRLESTGPADADGAPLASR